MRIPVRRGVDLAGIIADVASSFSRGCGADTVAKACLPPRHGARSRCNCTWSQRCIASGPIDPCEEEASKMVLGIMTDQSMQASTCS